MIWEAFGKSSSWPKARYSGTASIIKYPIILHHDHRHKSHQLPKHVQITHDKKSSSSSLLATVWGTGSPHIHNSVTWPYPPRTSVTWLYLLLHKLKQKHTFRSLDFCGINSVLLAWHWGLQGSILL